MHKRLRSQKPRRKRHLGGRDRRGQIPNRLPINERPSHIEDRKQVGHWEGDTVIVAAHKQAIVTLEERKSGFALLSRVSKKSADLVVRAIEAQFKPLNSRVKTLTVDTGRSLPITRASIRPLASRPTLPIRTAIGSAAAKRASMAYFANISPRSGA